MLWCFPFSQIQLLPSIARFASRPQLPFDQGSSRIPSADLLPGKAAAERSAAPRSSGSRITPAQPSVLPGESGWPGCWCEIPCIASAEEKRAFESKFLHPSKASGRFFYFPEEDQDATGTGSVLTEQLGVGEAQTLIEAVLSFQLSALSPLG